MKLSHVAAALSFGLSFTAAASTPESDAGLKPLLGKFTGTNGLAGAAPCSVTLSPEPSDASMVQIFTEGWGGSLVSVAKDAIQTAVVSDLSPMKLDSLECGGLYCSGPNTAGTINLAWSAAGPESVTVHRDFYFNLPNNRVDVGSADFSCDDLKPVDH